MGVDKRIEIKVTNQMSDFPFPPEELNNIINTAYGGGVESDRCLNIISELKTEPFILDFVKIVLSLDLNLLSDNTLYYCISATRSRINNDRSKIAECSAFFLNFYLKAFGRFTTPALINESTSLFGLLFRSNETDGCFIIKTLAEKQNGLSIIYSAVLVSSISSQQCLQNITQFIRKFMTCRDHQLASDTLLFVKMIDTFTATSLHPEIIKTINECGGAGKLFEISVAVDNQECSGKLLECIASFCVLHTDCFKTEQNKTNFLLSIAAALPVVLERELGQEYIERVVDIYNGLAKNRLVRMFENRELFGNWISAFSHITEFTLTPEHVIENGNFVENVLDVWVTISGFDLIRKSEEDRAALMECFNSIREQMDSFLYANAEAILNSFEEDCSSLILEKYALILSFEYDEAIHQIIDNLGSKDINVISISLELCTEILKKRLITLDCAQYVESDRALFGALFEFVNHLITNGVEFNSFLGKSIPMFFSKLLGVFITSNKKERIEFINENNGNVANVLYYLLTLLQVDSIPTPVLRDIIGCLDFVSFPAPIIEACLGNEQLTELALSLKFPFLWEPRNKPDASLFVQNVFYLCYCHSDPSFVHTLLHNIHDRFGDSETSIDAIRYLRTAFSRRNNKILFIFDIVKEQFFPIFIDMLKGGVGAKQISSLICHLITSINDNHLFITLTKESFAFYQAVVPLMQTILEFDQSPDVLGNLCTSSVQILKIKSYNLGVFALYDENSLVTFIQNMLDSIGSKSELFSSEKLAKKYWLFCSFIVDDQDLCELFFDQSMGILFSTASVYMMNSSRKDMPILFTTLEKVLKTDFNADESNVRQIIVSFLSLFASKKIQKLNYWSLMNQLIHRVEDSWFGLFSSICENQEAVEAFTESYSLGNPGLAQITITKILEGQIGNIVSFLNCEEMVSGFIGTTP